jgi:uncharacterized protein (DUF58 family)
MLTSRAWLCLVVAAVLVVLGVTLHLLALTLTGLALLLWLGGEWLRFMVAQQGRLEVHREVCDERGPVAALWAGQTFTVHVQVRLRGRAAWQHASFADLVPWGLEHVEGPTAIEGELRPGDALAWSYSVRCQAAGVARFEGVRARAADRQGFFYRQRFVRQAAVLRVLPVLAGEGASAPTRKRHNLLLPPGIHRLRRPGPGSELLDLRDYRPGDPPKTIAWKVTARRGRLMTKEFESEVPIRCTLFVDASNSVRPAAPAPGPRGAGQGKALDRLVELAAALVQNCAAARDPVGLCLFDEHGAGAVRPDRAGSHQAQMLNLLADTAALGPAHEHVPPERLLPLAYSFAEEVYPDLLDPAVNRVPFWLTWLVAFPGYTRRLRSLREALYHRKRLLLLVSSALVSVFFVLFPPRAAWALVAALAASLLLPLAAYVLVLAANQRRRQRAVWRKRLAALLSARYGLAPGGVEALMEEDDAFTLLVQRFLSDHRVPYTLPLYDERGRYRFAAPHKVEALAGALSRAVGKGRDNELFVLLADLLELDEHLEPLLRSVRVALARHHQVVVVCPWPVGLELPPGREAVAEPPPAGARDLVGLWGRAVERRFHAAYARLRRTFARMGVPVVCAAGDEPVPLVLDRMDRLRLLGRRRR